MIRQIFIIKGYSKSEEELETDRYYAEQYFAFFTSNSGGAYEKEEILYFEDITTTGFNKTIENLELNFSIVVLIGHGATQNDNQLFQLNKEEIIKAGQLEINADKQLFIVESCRIQIENIYTVDLNDKILKFKYGGLVRSRIDRNKARQLYNEQLERCENGLVLCFACSNNESAINYYFSNVLIQTAFNWHLEHSHHFETLNIFKLMNFITNEVNEIATKETGGSQNPQLIGNLLFPFSVSKF